MAENDEESLIGYDPLAWLHESDQVNNEGVSLSLQVPGEVMREHAQEAASETQSSELHVDEIYTEACSEPDAGIVNDALQTQQIMLDSVQNIQNVAQLHERLQTALDNGNKIDIDASAITTIDTATLQLLLVLKQTAIKLHKDVSIDFPSERFIEAANLLGLAELLDVDQAAAGFF